MVEEIYICYEDFDMEGCGHPVCAFRAEFDAIAWVNAADTQWNVRTYTKLEIL